MKKGRSQKPEAYQYTENKDLNNIINGLIPGLYHFRCHCKEISIVTPTADDIELIIPNGKIDWLFLDKGEWIKSMGYETNENFIKILFNLIKVAYSSGDYKIILHNKFGVKVNLFLTLPGVGNKQGHLYNVKSGFMIFPNGKLKCNTLLGGRQK